jgi:hypothetical protein
MEPECLLPLSQGPATCLYTEPNQSRLYPYHPISLRSILTTSHLQLGLPSGVSGSLTNVPYAPLLSHHMRYMSRPSHSS